MFYSGEVHPFRLPVPSLFLDVFQKIKALGYNGVSFYTDWALLEGKQGEFNASGIFDLEPFFQAAQTAGIYLLARPGPYINAEASGGGFPGWMQRNPALLRTRDPEYEHATDNYVSRIASIVAKAQITNGGPVICTYSALRTLPSHTRVLTVTSSGPTGERVLSRCSPGVSGSSLL